MKQHPEGLGRVAYEIGGAIARNLRSRGGILLHGGPMDGWIVASNAPVLRPGWKALPPSGFLARLFRRTAPVGRYVVRGREAFWEGEIPGPSIRQRLGGWWSSVRPLFLLAFLALAFVDAAAAGVALAFNIGQVFLELLADGARLRASIEKEAGKAGDAGAKSLSSRLSAGLTKVGKNLTDVGKSLTRNVTLPIVGLGAAIFKVGADFDTSLRQIVALTDVTADEIGGVREEILRLSTEVGKAPQELAQGFYFLASAGFDTAEALEVLHSTARASAAGLGTTADISKVVGAAINAYGHENLTAADAVDTLLRAIKKGTAEAPDFAQSLGRVLSVASLMGVTFSDLNAAIAALTLTGLDAEESTTSLQQVFVSLLKPTNEAEKALEGMGLSSAGLRQQLKQEGLLSLLKTLEQRFAGNDEAAAQVFGNVRALRGVLALLALDSEQLADVFEDVTNGTQNIAEAFADTEGPGRAFDRAMARVQVALIQLSADVLPVVADILESVSGAVQTIAAGFAKLPAPIRAGIVQFAALLAAIGPVVFIAGKFATGLGTLVGWLGKIPKAVQFVSAAFRVIGPKLAEVVSGLPGVASLRAAATTAGTKLGTLLGTTAGKAASIAFAAAAVFVAVIQFKITSEELAGQAKDIGEQVADGLTTATDEALEIQKAAIRTGLEQIVKTPGLGVLVSKGAIEELQRAYEAIEAEQRSRQQAVNAQAGFLAREGGRLVGKEFAGGVATELEANEDSVRRAADRHIRRPIAEQLVAMGADAVRKGAELALGIASGIRDKRAQIKAAFSTLKTDLKNALTPTKEIGENVGLLLSKAIRKGLKSGDPAARAQADGTRALVEAQLIELIAAGGKVGKKTLEELERAMKSKNPAVRAQAERTKAIIDEGFAKRSGPKTPGEQIGDDLASDLASKGTIIGKIAYDIGRTIARNLRAGVQGDRRIPYRTTIQAPTVSPRFDRRAGFAQGTASVPFDQLAMVHRGEIIVPREPSEAIRAGSAVLGAGPVTTTVTVGPISVDARGATNPRAVGQAVMDAVAEGLRQETARLPVGTRS